MTSSVLPDHLFAAPVLAFDVRPLREPVLGTALQVPPMTFPRPAAFGPSELSSLLAIAELVRTLRHQVGITDMVTDENERALRALDALRELTDNWDEEGAPRPSDAAIDRAQRIVRWADANAIDIHDAEIDADVLGGVAIWLEPTPGRRAWIACMNSGSDTLVISNNGTIVHAPWDEDAQQQLLAFLRSAHGG